MRKMTDADLKAAYRAVAAQACDIINSGRQCYPQLFCVEMAPAQPGRVVGVTGLPPDLVNSMQKDAHSKDAMMALVRILLEATRQNPQLLREKLSGAQAHIVVHVTEMWQISMDAKPGQTYAEARKERIPEGTEIKDQPDKTEALLINVHVPGRTYTSLSPITGSGDTRHCDLHPLMLNGEMTMTGRVTLNEMPEGPLK